MGGAAAETASRMLNNYGLIFGLRFVLAFLGAGIFGLFIYQTAASIGKEKLMSYFAYSAFILVLIAEILGRFLFYATHVQIGV